MLPGTSKLTWTADRHMLDFYFKEAAKQCKESLSLLNNFKALPFPSHPKKLIASLQAVHEELMAECSSISKTLFVSVEAKRIYSVAEFEALQKEHSIRIKAFLNESASHIAQCMTKVYTYFETDSDEVQREWIRYTKRIDDKIVEALKTAVRKSLQLISKCLNGEKRKEVLCPHPPGDIYERWLQVLPVFYVTMILDRSHRVELQPTIQSLFDMVHGVCRELVAEIKCMPRVTVEVSPRHLKELQALPFSSFYFP